MVTTECSLLLSQWMTGAEARLFRPQTSAGQRKDLFYKCINMAKAALLRPRLCHGVEFGLALPSMILLEGRIVLMHYSTGKEQEGYHDAGFV